jgi:hypothetical protein
MNNGWEMQKVAAMNGLIEDSVRLAGTIRERRVVSQAQLRAEHEFRVGYARALTAAKQSGVMPEEYQRRVGEDQLGRQVGIKVVALRELGKLDSNHPLVRSAELRSKIGTQTLINYNLADRPKEGDFNDFAPTEAQLQQMKA